MTNQNKILCCYHHPCLDGSAAAWIFKKKFGDDVQFLGINHLPKGHSPSNIFKHDFDTVYFLDYAPELQLAKKLLEQENKTVVIWDHHMSSFNSFAGYRHDNLEFIFAQNQSGAGITWRNAFPDEPIPDFIKLIEDLDLLQIELCADDEDTHFSAAAYIDSIDLTNTNKTEQTFNELCATDIAELAKRGHTLRHTQLIHIKDAIDQLSFVQSDAHPEISAHEIPMIYCDVHNSSRELESILLQSCTTINVAFIYYEEQDYIRINVRTDGITPANEIAHNLAKEHGISGGGNLNAAVVRLSKEKFSELFEK